MAFDCLGTHQFDLGDGGHPVKLLDLLLREADNIYVGAYVLAQKIVRNLDGIMVKVLFILRQAHGPQFLITYLLGHAEVFGT